MEIFNEETIKYCPYTALVATPRNFVQQCTFYKFNYVVRGFVNLEIYSRTKQQKVTKKLTPGSAIILTPTDICRYDTSTQSHDYCHRDIYLYETTMKEICNVISPSLFTKIMTSEFPHIFSLSQNTVISLEEMLTPLNIQYTSDYHTSLHKTILFYFLGAFMHDEFLSQQYPHWLSSLLFHLQNDISSLTKNLNEIIATTNYSHGYVCREFKKYVGKTLKQYLNEYKIYYSTTLLSDKSNTLESITNQLCFSTCSNYINLFKKQYKITPGQWRKQYFSNTKTFPNLYWGNFNITDHLI